MKWGFFFVLFVQLVFFGPSFAWDLKLATRDLHGNSGTCTYVKSKYPGLEKCNIGRTNLSDLKQVAAFNIGVKSQELSSELKNDYFKAIKSSLLSQYQAAVWMNRPLKAPEGEELRRAIESAEKKCGGENASDFSDIKEGMARTVSEAEAETRVLKVSEKSQEKIRQGFLKRLLIARLEMDRIEKAIVDRPIGKKEKERLQERVRKIREAYPLISTSSDGFTLKQTAMAQYGQVFDADSAKSHPDLDKILFPNPKTGVFDEVAVTQQTRFGNEAVVNKILQNDLLPNVERDLHSLTRRYLSRGFDSIGAFCGLNPCETMQMSLQATLDKVGSLKTDKANVGRAIDAVCMCNIQPETQAVGGGTQLLLAGATVGGLVLCPFTFGIGCFASSVTGGLSALAAAANTASAIKDQMKINPLVKAAIALPGFDEEEKRALLKNANDIAGNVIIGGAETAMGAVAVKSLASKGMSALKNPENFRPIRNSSLTADDIAKATSDQIEELKKAGVGFESDTTRLTEVGSDFKFNWGRYSYSRGSSTSDNFGQILRVTKLPPSAKKVGPSTKALEHPEMANYMKQLEEMGLDLVVDTSLRPTSTGAYFWNHTKVIAIRPDSTWQTFIHEFQHAQFETYIRPVFNQLKYGIVKEGKSVRDILSPDVLKQYSSKELDRLETLIRKENAELGVNETMSTARELDMLGWRQYIPGNGTPRSYGARHRVNSLMELRDVQRIKLTERQIKTLNESKTQAILAETYDNVGGTIGAIGGAAAAPVVVIKTAEGAYEVIKDIKMYYNQKTGDMITTTPDGKLLSVKGDKNNVENSKKPNPTGTPKK